MLKIFNTLTKKKEFFNSIYPGKVSIYVCGITVYDYCHIGHGRTFTFFDVVVRYLKYCQYKLNYVRNITDIDDKIIQKSKKNSEDISILTNRMIDSMNNDFEKLGLLVPDSQPRATSYISTIISMIKYFLKKKYAYILKNGDVVFSISSYKKYGLLSNQNLDDCKFVYTSDFNFSKIKNSGKDFVLWKIDGILSNEPTWKSPWGCGRPGWHIECSAINYTHFGKYLDIHGGGVDLLFPHHENEIAQSNCFNGITNYGNYWMHVGMLLIKNQKMSKTLNNTLFLKHILRKYNYEVIRYFLLSTHYRSPLYYDEENLKHSYFALKNLYITLSKYKENDPNFFKIKKIPSKLYNHFYISFYKAMDDDFNTPRAISVLFEMSKKINILLKENNFYYAGKLIHQLKYLGNIMGLLFQNPIYFLNRNNYFLNISFCKDMKIVKLLKERETARKYKFWNIADSIRLELLELNVLLKDTSSGTVWKKIDKNI